MLNNHLIVKQKFSNAAKNYLEYANIQKQSALEIISRLNKLNYDGTILDLGSGVGTLSHCDRHHHDTILFDLSLEMLRYSKSKQCINGNASNLPILSNSINIVISNLMIQWLTDKSSVMHEINRILKLGGYVILTTLVKGSLFELQRAWREVDEYQHTLEFDTVDDYEKVLECSKLKIIEIKTWRNTLYFSEIYELMYHFKRTGTNTRQANNTSGLSGKEKIKNFAIAYEKQRVTLGLPLSYQYLIIVAKKEL